MLIRIIDEENMMVFITVKNLFGNDAVVTCV